MAKNPRLIDLTGQVFGRLTVLKKDGNRKSGAAVWLCRCVCGKLTRPSGNELRSGNSTSCGHDKIKKLLAGCITHGLSGSRLYGTWNNMKDRCENPKNNAFKNYGGRGIKLCDEWQKPEAFLKWATLHGYRQGLSIERINNDLGYSPENCEWIPLNQQSANRRHVLINGDGILWRTVAAKNGINGGAFGNRIHSGWKVEDAATIPLGTKKYYFKSAK